MIRFSKYLWLYFFISAVVIIPGIYSLIRYGLKPAVDFTGGTSLELAFDVSVSEEQVKAIFQNQSIEPFNVQRLGELNYVIRMKPGLDEKLVLLEDSLSSMTPKATVVRNETVGPILGKELLTKTITAAIFAIIAIMSYVAYAFKNIKFGVSAILALIHDLLVVLGVFSLLGRFMGVEVDTLFVTAFLTTMSFSVHDTIVVFDRIREFQRKGERIPFDMLCDRALTETIGRSLTNSMTIIFMLLALVLMGGTSIHWFVVALLVGTISGTYSSDFVATPILILWERYEKRKKQTSAL